MPESKAKAKSLMLKRVSLTLFFSLWFGLVFSEELRFDFIPPSGSITINNNSLYTRFCFVTLNLSAQDNPGGTGIFQMQFSDDGLIWSLPEAYSTSKAWVLPLQDGIKTVYARFSDKAGNWSLAYSDFIVLDTLPPLMPTLNPITSPTDSSSQTLTGSRSPDTASILISSDYASVGTVKYPNLTTWSCEITNLKVGKNTFSLKAKDEASNETGSVTFTIVLDTTPPSGSIKINNDAQYTNSTSATLTLSSQDNSDGSGLSQMQFSNDGSNWSTPEAYATTKAWTLTSANEQKTVYVKFKDVVGNWSQAYSDTIILDTTPPSISIASVTSPTNQDVVLSYNVSDNLTPTAQIVVSGDNSPYTSEGSYNVTLTARDLAGNSSAASVSFTIDKTAPVVVITSPEDGAVVEDSQLQLEGTVDGQAFSELRTLNPGENTLTKSSTDAAGNTSSASVTVYLYLGQLIGPEGGEVSSPDAKWFFS